jgi:hypothetical protein
VGALCVFAAAGWYVYFLASGVIAPGVTSGGVDLAGQDLEQAALTLDQHFNQDYRLLAIDTSEPGRFWSVTPAEAGLSVDPAATAMAAFEIGRGPDPLTGLSQFAQSFQTGWAVAPIVRFDPRPPAPAEVWAAVVTVPSVEGTLSVAMPRWRRPPGCRGKPRRRSQPRALAADPAS